MAEITGCRRIKGGTKRKSGHVKTGKKGFVEIYHEDKVRSRSMTPGDQCVARKGPCGRRMLPKKHGADPRDREEDMTGYIASKITKGWC